MIIDLGLNSKHEIAKKIRGYVGFKIFRIEPWIKKKWFWNSGFWNPAYDIRSMNDVATYERYLDKQYYSGTGQRTIAVF